MPSQNTTILFDVQGLCCSAEAVLLERKVGALDGVVGFDANPVTRRLRVDFDPSRLTPQEIIRTVSETGMKAWLPERGRRRFAWWRESRVLLLGLSGLLTAAGVTALAVGLAGWLGHSLYLAAIVTGGYYPARAGLSATRTRTMNINTLLILGVVGAVGLDLWQEAAILVFVYSFGNVLESFVVSRARGAISSLLELKPQEALVIRDGRENVVATSELRLGDVVRVRPGDKIPIDGTVVSGGSFVDESAVTGEPMPVRKAPDAPVFAGTMNQQGSLTLRVTRTSEDTTLAKIIHAVEQAQTRKSKYQVFGERFSRVYTPLMFCLGLAVAVLPPLLTGMTWPASIYRALVVFVVSCSCGLALSVPVAIVAAVGNAARAGILLKGGLYLEKMKSVRTVAFDKTGTLTIGRPTVTRMFVMDGMSEAGVMSLAAAVETHSEHPLARAIVRRARESGSTARHTVEDFEAIPGRGARARVDGCDYWIGNLELFEEAGLSAETVGDTVRGIETDAQTAVVLGDSERCIGVFAISDIVKPESRDAIARIESLGIDVVMLTGDAKGTANAIARELGIDDHRSGLLPQDKIDVINALRRERGGVMMVGDGINDSPAMAASDVGVAMGAAGTDVAMETGDVVLLADDLMRIPYVIELGRRTVANIRQNVFASLFIIALLVPAALLGRIDLLTGLLINEGAALLVILNGLRLLR